MSDYESEQIEAIQNVVDRVSAYQDGATEVVVVEELRKGFDEVAVEVQPDDVTKIAEAIESEDFDSLEDKVDEDDQKKAEAFTDWADDYCADDSSSDSEPSSDAT